MQKPVTKPRRKLIPFRDFIKDPKSKPRPPRKPLAEAKDATDDVTDLQYYGTVLPKDASPEEKRARLSELSRTVRDIDSSDVFVIGMWIG